MLVHVHGHLHLETPPIEPYMVTTLLFKNVIETLTPTYVLSPNRSVQCLKTLPLERIVCQVFQ